MEFEVFCPLREREEHLSNVPDQSSQWGVGRELGPYGAGGAWHFSKGVACFGPPAPAPRSARMRRRRGEIIILFKKKRYPFGQVEEDINTF